jgi:head-tail adaptor
MSGRLDQKIALECLTTSPDGAGGNLRTFAAVEFDPAPFAGVVLKGGGEGGLAGGKVARQAAVFTLRARGDLKPTDRILWDGCAWDIKLVVRAGARVRYIKIEADTGGRAL